MERDLKKEVVYFLRKIDNVLFSREYKFRAEFYDVDSMGVMWHGNYVRYVESARCRFLDDVKFNYNDMKQSGFAMPIIKMEFKYIAPIFFNADFSIRVDLLDFDSILRFQYIFLQDFKILSLAQTSQAAFDISSNSTLYKLPDELSNAIDKFIKGEKYEKSH